MGRSVLEGAFSLLDELVDEGELGLTCSGCPAGGAAAVAALSATIRTSAILTVPRL